MNNATKQSLVLIDEFGKGTNTVRRQKDEKLRRGSRGKTKEHEGDAVPQERNRGAWGRKETEKCKMGQARAGGEDRKSVV